jgi:hypothetical protein
MPTPYETRSFPEGHVRTTGQTGADPKFLLRQPETDVSNATVNRILKKARVLGIGSLDTEELVRLAYREGTTDTLRRLRNMPDEEVPELRLV